MTEIVELDKDAEKRRVRRESISAAIADLETGDPIKVGFRRDQIGKLETFAGKALFTQNKTLWIIGHDGGKYCLNAPSSRWQHADLFSLELDNSAKV